MWSGGRLTKIHTTTRPDHVWPEVRTKIGKPAQNREKQEWAKEKPKLDNARKPTGIHHIDPDDEEHKEILKHAKNLERPMAAMPCKKICKRHHESVCEVGDCIREEFQNSVWLYSGILSTPKKGVTSMTYHSVAHKFIPMPQAMKIPDDKAAVVKKRR